MNTDPTATGNAGSPIAQAVSDTEKTEHGLEEAERRSKIEIIVNSRPREVPGHTVTFEQVVQLAFPGPQPPNTVFSMTYRNAASTPHAGELGPGGTVKVKNGTIFNVTKTVQS